MIGLIDGDVLLHATLWGVKDLAYFNNKLAFNLDEWSLRAFADSYVIALGGSYNYRDDLYELYKKSASRESQRHNRVDFFAEAKESIAGLEQTSITEGIEADDLIGHWVSQLGNNSVVITVDKDLNQLPGLKYDPNKERYYNVSADEAKVFFNKQMVIGDAIDNIPGIPNMGPVKFRALADDFDLIELYKEKLKDDWESYFLANGKLLWIQKFPDDHFTIERYKEWLG